MFLILGQLLACALRLAALLRKLDRDLVRINEFIFRTVWCRTDCGFSKTRRSFAENAWPHTEHVTSAIAFSVCI